MCSSGFQAETERVRRDQLSLSDRSWSAPDYDPAKVQAKIVLPQDLLEAGTLNVFHSPSRSGWPPGNRPCHRREMLEIVAATNLKQRSRMSTLISMPRPAICRHRTANKNEHARAFL